jgi:uncharacterized protein (TIGR03086 family)
MDALLRSLSVARDGFTQRLRAVGFDDWARPTPCSEWDVRLLVNHVVGGDVRAVRLLGGGTFAEFLATRDDDVVDADPLGAWTRAAEAFDAAFSAPGALDRPVHYRTGATTARELLRIRVFDMTVHTWDLAHAVGADETLDDNLVAESLETWAALSATGVVANVTLFAPPRTAGHEGASPQERLLRACGR